VALVGDAAHAFIPGFGGAMALEDAHVLADELHRVTDGHVEQALEAYTARRRPRIARVRLASDMLEKFTMIHNPFVVLMREAMLRRAPDALVTRSIEDLLSSPF